MPMPAAEVISARDMARMRFDENVRRDGNFLHVRKSAFVFSAMRGPWFASDGWIFRRLSCVARKYAATNRNRAVIAAHDWPHSANCMMRLQSRAMNVRLSKRGCEISYVRWRVSLEEMPARPEWSEIPPQRNAHCANAWNAIQISARLALYGQRSEYATAYGDDPKSTRTIRRCVYEGSAIRGY